MMYSKYYSALHDSVFKSKHGLVFYLHLDEQDCQISAAHTWKMQISLRWERNHQISIQDSFTFNSISSNHKNIKGSLSFENFLVGIFDILIHRREILLDFRKHSSRNKNIAVVKIIINAIVMLLH